MRARDAQNRSVRHAPGIIDRTLQKRLRIAGRLRLAVFQRPVNLLAAGVVGKLVGRSGAVVEHRAGGVYPCHAVIWLEAVKIRGALRAQTLRNGGFLRAEPRKRLILIVAVHDAEEQKRAGKKRRDGDEIRISENFSRHMPDPSL